MDLVNFSIILHNSFFREEILDKKTNLSSDKECKKEVGGNKECALPKPFEYFKYMFYTNFF